MDAGACNEKRKNNSITYRKAIKYMVYDLLWLPQIEIAALKSIRNGD